MIQDLLKETLQKKKQQKQQQQKNTKNSTNTIPLTFELFWRS